VNASTTPTWSARTPSTSRAVYDRLADWAALAVTVARADRVTSLVVDDSVTTTSDPDYGSLRQLVRQAISGGSTASAAPTATPSGGTSAARAVDVRTLC
jgi:hypothetical protein